MYYPNGTSKGSCLPVAARVHGTLCFVLYTKKKGCSFEQPFFIKVDLISLRTHQMLSSHSTWNLRLGYPKLVCIQCC